MSAIVSIPDYDTLPLEAKLRYDEQVKTNGRMTNMKRALLHSPLAFDALMTWYPLFHQLENLVGKRPALFFAYSISNENNCLICNTFFIKILKDLGIQFENFSFDETEDLLIQYGRALVLNPHEIDSSITQALKKRFSEENIILLTAFGSIMIATNLINTALKIPLDKYLFEYASSNPSLMANPQGSYK